MATEQETRHGPRIVKVIRLESYEDTLNNLAIRRPRELDALLNQPRAKEAGGFAESYVLGYMLDVETRGSASLLNIAAIFMATDTDGRTEILLPVIRNLGTQKLKIIRLKKTIDGVSTEGGDAFGKLGPVPTLGPPPPYPSGGTGCCLVAGSMWPLLTPRASATLRRMIRKSVFTRPSRISKNASLIQR